MEPAGVPALLAYRGGDKFAGLVPVLDEIPDEDELSAESLAAAMTRFVLCQREDEADEMQASDLELIEALSTFLGEFTSAV